MKLQIGNDAYVIHWRHEQQEWQVKGIIMRGATRCIVKINGGNESGGLTFEGTAYCSAKEPMYIKAKGRKASLTRALELVPREIRAEIWKGYLNL